MTRVRLAILAGLLFVAPAQAQTTIDVAKITCRQFTMSNVAHPDQIVLWLSGYHHAKHGNTTIDVESLKGQRERIHQYCEHKNKDATVMEAVENLLQSKK